jgi:hypothetical protein
MTHTPLATLDTQSFLGECGGRTCCCLGAADSSDVHTQAAIQPSLQVTEVEVEAPLVESSSLLTDTLESLRRRLLPVFLPEMEGVSG